MCPLVIFFPFRYVMQLRNLLHQRGKIFSFIFPPAEFFRCYSGGLYGVVFHSFYASFFRYYCESCVCVPTKGARTGCPLMFQKHFFFLSSFTGTLCTLASIISYCPELRLHKNKSKLGYLRIIFCHLSKTLKTFPVWRFVGETYPTSSGTFCEAKLRAFMVAINFLRGGQ